MIDFESLAKSYKVVVPVLNKKFIFNKKSYHVNAENGWWLVEIKGNRVRALEPSIKDTYNIMGYTCNNLIIFHNADVAKRKYKLDVSVELNFNQSSTFEPIRAEVWEDGKVYYVGPNYSEFKSLELKDILESDGSIEKEKGITPELRMVYLFHSLEKARLKELAELAKAKADHERMMKDVPYRLTAIFQRSGAQVINFSIKDKRIKVDWKFKDYDYKYNTIVDYDSWKIIEAGYCMSGDDKRHNITSLVKTAEEYEEKNLIYITRH